MKKNTLKDAIMGVVVGDALGVPMEFRKREYFKHKPFVEMIGYGSHQQPPGTWSDDSSLTLCLAESLCDGYNLTDIAIKMTNWINKNNWTPFGEVFDIGFATRKSLSRLNKILDKADSELCIPPSEASEHDNGNGALMRILPLVFITIGKPVDEKFRLIKEVSTLTHGHIRSVISCFIYLIFAEKLIETGDKNKAYEKMVEIVKPFLSDMNIDETEKKNFDRILNNNIGNYSEDEIFSTGYVLHTIEASLWCLLNNNDYSSTVIKAVNLGDDTDTTAAVTGGLAGILYGFDNIPENWVRQIVKKEEIFSLIERFGRQLSLGNSRRL